MLVALNRETSSSFRRLRGCLHGGWGKGGRRGGGEGGVAGNVKCSPSRGQKKCNHESTDKIYLKL